MLVGTAAEGQGGARELRCFGGESLEILSLRCCQCYCTLLGWSTRRVSPPCGRSAGALASATRGSLTSVVAACTATISGMPRGV